MEIMKHFLEGVRKFSQKECQLGSVYNRTVEEGQKPQVMVIGCCDSMVDPLLLMGAQAGELFIHRSIAALIPPYQQDGDYPGTTAALEHGVKNLQVEHLVVMGHGCCGGIAALMNHPTGAKDNSILSWMQLASSAKKKVLTQHPEASDSDKKHLCEKEGVIVSLNNLLTFPWIEERVNQGKLQLHGWHFNRGVLSMYDASQQAFNTVDLRQTESVCSV